MRYRKLDTNGDYSFGNQQADFYINQPEAVAQAIATRLHLNLGEWFLDTTDGTAWNTQVLGNRTIGTRDAVIKSRVLGTQGVVSPLVAYASQMDPNTRVFSVQLTAATTYGETAPVTENLTPPWLDMPVAPDNLQVTSATETSVSVAWND